MSVRFRLGLVLSLCACAGGGLARGANPSHTDAGLEELRSATRGYEQLDSAVRAGYAAEVQACLVHEHHGAMGYHHVNRSWLDAKAEVSRPEILLYERLPDSSYRLNGVEFIVPYGSWPRDSVPPVVLGQKMKQEDNLKFWYLHVWAWKPNPDGVFADFHPEVRCPEGASRIFRPFTRGQG